LVTTCYYSQPEICVFEIAPFHPPCRQNANKFVLIASWDISDVDRGQRGRGGEGGGGGGDNKHQKRIFCKRLLCVGLWPLLAPFRTRAKNFGRKPLRRPAPPVDVLVLYPTPVHAPCMYSVVAHAPCIYFHYIPHCSYVLSEVARAVRAVRSMRGGPSGPSGPLLIDARCPTVPYLYHYK
jgi:hypothetical protein